jgi:triacylglycerol lipase
MRVPLLLVVAASACATPLEEGGQSEPDKQELADQLADGKADDGIDWCARWDWYDDGECDQLCLRPDPDCQTNPLGPEPAGRRTRYPIVLVHGFMGTADSPMWSFWKVADKLRADGHVVIEADLPPFDAPANRAAVLASQIDAAIAQYGKVNLIAHSQGGLDSRYLISSLGYGDRVASLTSISSPHQGTAIADKALGLLPGGTDASVNSALRTIGLDVADVNVRATLTAMSERNAPAFNAANRDDARVMYQSWAGVSSRTGVAGSVDLSVCDGKLLGLDGALDKLGVLMPSLVWKIVGHGRGDANDGVATVAGAKHGTFRGCIPADHMDEVGQVQDTYDTATGFDHLRFYRNMAFELAAAGL